MYEQHIFWTREENIRLFQALQIEERGWIIYEEKVIS